MKRFPFLLWMLILFTHPLRSEDSQGYDNAVLLNGQRVEKMYHDNGDGTRSEVVYPSTSATGTTILSGTGTITTSTNSKTQLIRTSGSSALGSNSGFPLGLTVAITGTAGIATTVVMPDSSGGPNASAPLATAPYALTDGTSLYIWPGNPTNGGKVTLSGSAEVVTPRTLTTGTLTLPANTTRFEFLVSQDFVASYITATGTVTVTGSGNIAYGVFANRAAEGRTLGASTIIPTSGTGVGYDAH